MEYNETQDISCYRNFLFCFCSLNPWPRPLPSESNSPGLSGKIEIRVSSSGIFLHADNADIKDLLAELSRKTGVVLSADPQINAKISLDMKDADLEQILKKICANRAVVYTLDSETGAYTIVSGYGFDTTQERATSSIKTDNIDPFLPPVSKTPQTKIAKTATMQGNVLSPDKKMYDAKGRLLYKPGELLVKLKKNILPADIQTLHTSLGSRVLETIKSLRLQRIALKKDMDEDEAAMLYMQSGLVDIAEKNALRYKNAVPDDPLFNQQWGMAMLQAPQAWDIATGSDAVVVAVIDTGVDYSHPDLADNIWTNTAELAGVRGVDDDGNGFVDDIQGWDFAGDGENEDNDPLGDDSHGTHVAGIIAAGGNNGMGVAGVCWNLKIMPIKIQAEGEECMTTVDIILGMEYAMENGARVINCSYGGPSSVDSEKEMLSLLGEQGILAVCAAGNDGSDIDGNINNYPAGYDLDNILSVAANGQDGGLWSDSNFGETSVDVMAPGVGITSTVLAGSISEALLTIDINGSISTFAAEEIEFSGRTDEAGITGRVYDCGLGKSSDDFPAAVSGNMALIQRGDIDFSEKTEKAMDAGATGVIIYNNVPGDINSFTLQNPGNWVPVVAISQADGGTLLSILDEQPVVTLVNQVITSTANYDEMSGTSMATPHVTGLAALMLAVNPNLDYSRLKSMIMDTVDPVESAAGKIVTGGRVNAYAAVTAARKGDFDCDGQVDLADLIMVLRVVGGADYVSCGASTLAETDPDGDGRIGLSDAVFLLQIISGIL